MSAPDLDSAAAEAVLRRQLDWARRGTSALLVLLGGRRQTPWQHYPRDDVIDSVAGWQLYWHAHPAHHAQPPNWVAEMGHLHLFQRGDDGALAHLLGLSLDAKGQPLRWFTTNLWVTGGRWLSAETAFETLMQLPWQRGGRLAGVLAWLRDLLQAYRLPLRTLLQERDRALAALATSRSVPIDTLHEDRDLSLLSCLPIAWPDELIDGQVQTIWAADQDDEPSHRLAAVY